MDGNIHDRNGRTSTGTPSGDAAEARLLLQRGDQAGAESLCRRIVADVPDHAEAHLILGLIAHGRHNRDAALNHLRLAAASPGASFACQDALAHYCFEIGLLDEAADASRKALILDADQPRAWHRLALIRLRQQRLEDARQALEQVLRLQPDAPAALSNLGSVLQQLGRHDQAIDCYERALQREPGYAEAHSNLAAALAILGRYDDALLHAERAVALKPDYVSPYVHAAFAEADRGRCDAALAWMERVPAAARETPPLRVARAEILNKFERYEEAAQHCRAALAAQPNNGDAHQALGFALDMMQQTEDAIAALECASRLLAAPALPLAHKGALLMQLGRDAEGLAALDAALRLAPDAPNIHYMRASARDFRLEAGDIDAMEGLLARESASPFERIQLHFAIGGACLRNPDLGNPFAHLHAGNRLKRSLVDYDPAAEDERFAAIASAFSAARLAAASGAGRRSDLPVFVIGMPRSGTTLVEQILASHPDVRGGGEMREFGLALRAAEQARGRSYPEVAAALAPDDLTALGDAYLLRASAMAQGKARLVDKMPSNAPLAGLIHLALPDARIVHVRRNPYDTCFSCYSILFTTGQPYAYDLGDLGRYYHAHDALMTHWRAVLPSERFLEIDYELLVEDLEAHARRLVAFCGLDWSPACLSFHETQRTVRTASRAQVRQPLYRSSVGRWRAWRDELAQLFAVLGPPD